MLCPRQRFQAPLVSLRCLKQVVEYVHAFEQLEEQPDLATRGETSRLINFEFCGTSTQGGEKNR